jgi:hypothetical protein
MLFFFLLIKNGCWIPAPKKKRQKKEKKMVAGYSGTHL